MLDQLLKKKMGSLEGMEDEEEMSPRVAALKELMETIRQLKDESAPPEVEGNKVTADSAEKDILDVDDAEEEAKEEMYDMSGPKGLAAEPSEEELMDFMLDRKKNEGPKRKGVMFAMNVSRGKSKA